MNVEKLHLAPELQVDPGCLQGPPNKPSFAGGTSAHLLVDGEQ